MSRLCWKEHHFSATPTPCFDDDDDDYENNDIRTITSIKMVGIHFLISLTMMMKWWMVILHILDSTLPPPTCAPNQHLLVVTNHFEKLSFNPKIQHLLVVTNHFEKLSFNPKIQHLLVLTNHLGKLSFDLKGRHLRKKGCFFLERGPKDQASVKNNNFFWEFSFYFETALVKEKENYFE